MTAAGGDKFSGLIREVAVALWGEPNAALSKKDELRWGTHGARAVSVAKDTWHDHEDGTGGGVLDLIVREVGGGRAEAAKWLEERGFITSDRSSGRGARQDRAPDGPPMRDPDDPGPVAPPPQQAAPKAQITATYDYTDEGGNLLFQVCRMEVPGRTDIPKTFRQRRPDPAGRGGWNWSVKGVRPVPYRLPEVIEALSQGLLVFIAEGEKDVNRLWAEGVPATCNAGGAGKWPDELSGFFNGARVVILPDNDEAGAKHRNTVGRSLHKIAREVLWLDLPGVPEKGDPFDWIEAGGDAAALYDLVDSNAQIWTPETSFESRFGAVPWARLSDPGAEHEWLVKDLLVRQEVSMAAGPSQSGKSFYCLDLALAVARGVPFFGHKVSHPGGVIYQAGEGARGIRKRLRAYMEQKGVDTSDPVPFVLLPATLDLYGSDDPTKAFIDEVRHWSNTFDVPLELIVIDTYSTATPGANENASDDTSRILGRVARIAAATNAHVLIVHHMNSDGSKPRGHTSLFANMDAVQIITETEEVDDPIIVPDYRKGGDRTIRRKIRRATLKKLKDGEANSGIDFVLNAVKIGEDEDGDAVTSCVIEPPTRSALTDAPVAREKGIDLTPQCFAYLRAVGEALSEYGQPAPIDTGLSPSVRVVPHGYVKRIFEQSSFEFSEDDDADRRAEAVKKAIQRHGNYLMKYGVIAKHGRMVWLTGKKVKGFDAADKLPPREEKMSTDNSKTDDGGEDELLF